MSILNQGHLEFKFYFHIFETIIFAAIVVVVAATAAVAVTVAFSIVVSVQQYCICSTSASKSIKHISALCFIQVFLWFIFVLYYFIYSECRE